MNITTKLVPPKLKTWMAKHPKSAQWLWFAALWIFGLLSVTIATYPLKLLIKSMG